MRRLLQLLMLLCAAAAGAARAADNTPVVVAHAAVARVDAATLQRLYTGRAIEVAGQPVTVVSLVPGSPLRERFLNQVVGLDDERYLAYWTVRRHVGKGIPPRELKTAAEVLEFVRGTPGAIGYVGAADLKPGVNVIYRP